MRAAVIYESLTGNTRRTARLIGDELGRAGVETAVFPITRIDYQALAEADLVIVGSWTDGLVFVGQRPGRAGRIRRLPVVTGKKCVVFCTYAVNCGATLDKLTRIMEGRGAEVLGGMAIRRNRIPSGAKEFVGRVLEALAA
jgi:flavorubredoxin